MKDVLSRSQLKRLAEHRYNVAGVSLAEPLFQGFWRSVVDRIPDWWAPNALTFAGLLVNVVTTVILMVFSPDAAAEVGPYPIGPFVPNGRDFCGAVF